MIRNAKAADPRDALTLQWLPFADLRARRRWYKNTHYDDIRQEMLVGLVLAARAYDPTRGTPYIALARWYIISGVQRHWRRWRRGPWRGSVVGIPHEALSPDGDDRLQIAADDESPEAYVLRVDTTRRVNAALDTLTARERSVLLLSYQSDDTTGADIGKHLGLSRERVRQLRENALRKIRRALDC